MAKKKQPKRRPIRRDAFSVLARAVGRYLKTKGWDVIVVGNPRVQKQPGEFEFNYEFVLRFTGRPPSVDAVDPSAADPGTLTTRV